MRIPLHAAAVIALSTVFGHAHPWTGETSDKEALRAHILDEWLRSHPQLADSRQIRPVQTASLSSVLQLTAAAVAGEAPVPETAKAFLPFKRLDLRADGQFLYVGSNGLPDHNMMVGITNWQQQVPLPQPYFGDNAWRIPLHPKPAKTPARIENRFLRGAIALAVNGIPIFNPQNNRGEVAHEIGELDRWGGHCGRGDDYHYHIAPLHLQTVVGKGMPVAYALDGYPIYGLTEPDGSPLRTLDECHGHEDAKFGYHYHASTKRPYLQSAFHGEVVEAGGQVDPQPRGQHVRGDGAPLRGAEITAFDRTDKNTCKLSYTVGGETCFITYSVIGDQYAFEYNSGGRIVKQTYTPRRDGRGGPKGEGQGRPSPAQP